MFIAAPADKKTIGQNLDIQPSIRKIQMQICILENRFFFKKKTKKQKKSRFVLFPGANWHRPTGTVHYLQEHKLYQNLVNFKIDFAGDMYQSKMRSKINFAGDK